MLSIIFASTLAFAQSQPSCPVYKAQFIGNVFAVRKEMSREKTICFFQVETVMYNPSYLCPISYGEAIDTIFVDEFCRYKDGDRISGEMTKQGDVITID